jgi:hypothetical protein
MVRPWIWKDVGAKRDLQRLGMHMVTVDDEPAPRVARESRADGAGLAVAELRHGVEQVREAAHARGDGRLQFLVCCVRVPGGNDDAGIRQRADD